MTYPNRVSIVEMPKLGQEKSCHLQFGHNEKLEPTVTLRRFGTVVATYTWSNLSICYVRD